MAGSRTTLAALGFLLLALSPCPAFAGEPLLVDEVVAVVNRHVITRSEMREEAALILAERRGPQDMATQQDPEFLGQVMDFLVDQRVMLDESSQLGMPVVTDQERDQLLEGLKKRFADEPAFRRFLQENALCEEAVAEVLVRHLRVERMKENKLRSLPEVSDQEVQRYYQDHRARFGAAPLPSVAEAIRLRLITQQRDQALARWMVELRKRSEVKILVDLTGGNVTGE